MNHLTAITARRIKLDLVAGFTQASLAEYYGVTTSAISWIATGRSYAEVTVPGWNKFLASRRRWSKAACRAQSKLLREIRAA